MKNKFRRLMNSPRVIYTLSVCFPTNINDRSAEYIIWAPNFFSSKFFYSDNFQRVIFTYHHLKQSGKEVTIYTKKDIGRFFNKKIIYFGGKFYNEFGVLNYVSPLISLANDLEDQGNTLFPSSKEILLWENKSHMHDYFSECDISTPESDVLPLEQLINKSEEIEYPCLVKEEHSCSSNGVHKVVSADDLNTLIQKKNLKKSNKKVIIQELLNMRTDLRVILTGDEIIWSYWRKNLSSEWKPTSTGAGGAIEFGEFPEKWRDWIIDQFKRLDITTGAFDIAWQNDDLNTTPYILEVSPFYQPNPKPGNDENLLRYGAWKKSKSLKDNYGVAFSKLMFEIQEKFVKELCNSSTE